MGSALDLALHYRPISRALETIEPQSGISISLECGGGEVGRGLKPISRSPFNFELVRIPSHCQIKEFSAVLNSDDCLSADLEESGSIVNLIDFAFGFHSLFLCLT